MILFGYESEKMTLELLEDGTLIFRSGERKTVQSIGRHCLMRVRAIVDEHCAKLQRCGREINAGTDPAEENCFIFVDFRIVDWDLTRWYVEEDRKKHPEYYKNTVKVELTENYVRGVFDEICSVLEEEEKQFRYMQTLIKI